MMGQRLHNVVVINGKQYSVDTGKLLDIKKPAQEKPIVTTSVKKLINAGGPTDIRKPQHVSHHPHNANHTDLRAHATIASISANKRPVLVPKTTKLADGITSKRPQSIKTKSPAHKVHNKLKVASSTDRLPQPKTPKISHLAVATHTKSAKQSPATSVKLDTSKHSARRIRAAQHRRHEKISRFAAARRTYATTPPKSEIKETVIELQHPVKAPESTIQDRIAASQASLASNIAKHHPRHRTSHAVKTADDEASTVIKEAPRVKAKVSFLDRIGLANKLAPALAVSAVALILVGYITYLNVPNLALRVAANRAGFDASMPGYTPEGFSFDGPIAYNSGQITVDFRSNTGDDRAYSLSQRKSNWNSESLLANIIKPKGDDYLTFQDRGLTIYVYDSQATWVNGGVWYTINSNSSQLNTEQLVKIASSL